jgi:hypothetical protein
MAVPPLLVRRRQQDLNRDLNCCATLKTRKNAKIAQ